MAPHSIAVLVIAILAVSTIFVPNCSADLVDDTCKQIPNSRRCVAIIRADPKSSRARDVTSLALIVVDSLKSKSNSALSTINQLLKSRPELKVALNECLKKYNFILKFDITEAVEALTKGNPKFAEEATTDAASWFKNVKMVSSPPHPLSPMLIKLLVILLM